MWRGGFANPVKKEEITVRYIPPPAPPVVLVKVQNGVKKIELNSITDVWIDSEYNLEKHEVTLFLKIKDRKNTYTVCKLNPNTARESLSKFMKAIGWNSYISISNDQLPLTKKSLKKENTY